VDHDGQENETAQINNSERVSLPISCGLLYGVDIAYWIQTNYMFEEAGSETNQTKRNGHVSELCEIGREDEVHLNLPGSAVDDQETNHREQQANEAVNDLIQPPMYPTEGLLYVPIPLSAHFFVAL
jgi:hypothetical protein